MSGPFISFLIWPGTGIAIGVLLLVVLGQAARLNGLARRVERLERASYGTLSGSPSAGDSFASARSPAVSLAELSDEQTDHLRALLIQKKKIDAIKDLREWTRVGLKEAKERVETLEAQMKAQGDL